MKRGVGRPPIEEPRTRQFMVRLTEDLYDRFQVKSQEKDVPMAQIVREFIKSYVSPQRKKRKKRK